MCNVSICNDYKYHQERPAVLLSPKHPITLAK